MKGEHCEFEFWGITLGKLKPAVGSFIMPYSKQNCDQVLKLKDKGKNVHHALKIS